jgi:hypothetical protein
MKDNSFHNDDNWKGALSDKFDSENIAAPNKAWNQIESELFPKKKRRFAAFWSLMAGLFISGFLLINLNSGNDEIKNQPILSSEKGTPKENKKQKERVKEHKSKFDKELKIPVNRGDNFESKNQPFQNTTNRTQQKVLSENSKSAKNQVSNNLKSTKNKKHKVNETLISTNSITSTSSEDQIVLQEDKINQQDNLMTPNSINSGLHAMDSILYLEPFPMLPLNVSLSPELKLFQKENVEKKGKSAKKGKKAKQIDSKMKQEMMQLNENSLGENSLEMP